MECPVNIVADFSGKRERHSAGTVWAEAAPTGNCMINFREKYGILIRGVQREKILPVEAVKVLSFVGRQIPDCLVINLPREGFALGIPGAGVTRRPVRLLDSGLRGLPISASQECVQLACRFRIQLERTGYL